MSQQNIELVQGLLELFKRGEHREALDSYAPGIEWDASRLRTMIPDIAGVFHGHEGVRRYWRRWMASWRDLQFEVGYVRAGEGGQVVALIQNQRQWGRHSGVETSIPPYALVFTIDDGKVVRWCTYPDEAEALEAAGIET